MTRLIGVLALVAMIASSPASTLGVRRGRKPKEEGIDHDTPAATYDTGGGGDGGDGKGSSGTPSPDAAGELTSSTDLCSSSSDEDVAIRSEQLMSRSRRATQQGVRRLTETQIKLLSAMVSETGPTHVYGLHQQTGLPEETTRSAMLTLAEQGFVVRASEADSDDRYPYTLVSKEAAYEAIIAEQERYNTEVSRELAKLARKLEKISTSRPASTSRYRLPL